MAPFKFNRGISAEFVEALNEEYKKCGWWRNLVDDQETFVAIREGYLNVYYRGCSLLELSYTDRRLVGKVNYKYLVQPNLKDEEVTVINGKPGLDTHRKLIFIEDLVNVENVKALKNAAEPYAGEEKTGVHDIIHNRHNRAKVLDVEITFGGGGRRRIDLAALCPSRGGIEVRFYEAKHFSNHGALRVKAAHRDPEVIKQVDVYSDLLERYRAQIEESYRKVCCNLSKLDGIGARDLGRHKLLKGIANDPTQLRINPKCRLLVFGFDEDQRDGPNWEPHRDKLYKRLPDRVLMAGDAKDITLCSRT